MERHGNDIISKEGEKLKDTSSEGETRVHKIEETIKEALDKDPTIKKVELPITPSEGMIFTPKNTFFQKVGNRISQTTKWGVMLNALMGLGSSGIVWLTGLGFTRDVNINIVQYIIASVFVLLGFGGWIIVKKGEIKEKESLQKIAREQQEATQDQEVHEQQLKFKSQVFEYDQEIKMKKALLQMEIERNQNVEVMAVFLDIVTQKPKTDTEIPLYIEQLKVASKVLDTLFMDRALKYGEFENYQSNLLVKELKKLVDIVNIMVNVMKGENKSVVETYRHYEDEIYKKVDDLERIEAIANSNKMQSKYAIKEDVGIIEVLNKDKIINVNSKQSLYSGTGIYDWVGKSVVDFIETEYPTDQRNIMLSLLQDVYLGKYQIIPFKNMVTASGQMVDLTLAIFPTFKHLDVIGFTVITVPYTEDEATIPPIIFNEEEDCLGCNQILILLANPSEKELVKQEKIIKHMKYESHQASTISEAEIILSQHPIDMVIMDMYFEDGRALDFCIKLKNQYPFLKVIIFSSIVNKTMKKNLLQLSNVYAFHQTNDNPIYFMKSLQAATIEVLDERTVAEREKNKTLTGELEQIIPKPEIIEPVEEKVENLREDKKGGVNLYRG